ncbi:hypothetical protein C7212DRAFT_322141, partial [Tuber magnatum]
MSILHKTPLKNPHDASLGLNFPTNMHLTATPAYRRRLVGGACHYLVFYLQATAAISLAGYGGRV